MRTPAHLLLIFLSLLSFVVVDDDDDDLPDIPEPPAIVRIHQA